MTTDKLLITYLCWHYHRDTVPLFTVMLLDCSLHSIQPGRTSKYQPSKQHVLSIDKVLRIFDATVIDLIMHYTLIILRIIKHTFHSMGLTTTCSTDPSKSYRGKNSLES